MTKAPQPAEETIAGRPFSRVDFNGVGLFRSTWTTQIRCHLVSFSLMANKPELLAGLTLSLNKIAYGRDRAGDNRDPVCIDNYADAKNRIGYSYWPRAVPGSASFPNTQRLFGICASSR